MKVVFLDRDGVINEYPGDGNYVTKVKDFHFIPGALDAIRRLTQEGYEIFVVSNQAGVGKGVYSQDKLDRITRTMMDGVGKAGGKIRRVYYCTHRSDAGCGCRKPNVDSIERALKLLKRPMKDASRAFFVGDTAVDMAAGKNAGCTTILVLSGSGTRAKMRGWDVKPDFVVKDLSAAVDLIVKQNGACPTDSKGCCCCG